MSGTFMMHTTITKTLAQIPYKGKWIFFRRCLVKKDLECGWRYINPEETNIQVKTKKKSIIFDPIELCKINLEKEIKSLVLKKDRNEKICYAENEIEDHKTINFSNIKKKVKQKTKKFDLDVDVDVIRIISFALQKYYKNVLIKLYVNSQIRTNLQIYNEDLKNIIETTTKPSFFLKQIYYRDESRKKTYLKIQEMESIQREAYALQGNQILTKRDIKKLQELNTKQIQARKIIEFETKSFSCTLSKIQSLNKSQSHKIKSNKIIMIDVIRFLENEEKFHKSDLLYYLYLNLGRKNKIKFNL